MKLKIMIIFFVLVALVGLASITSAGLWDLSPESWGHIYCKLTGCTFTGNISAPYFLNGTGHAEWIESKHIKDVDDEDIETDLNTYVDIAGDNMSGSFFSQDIIPDLNDSRYLGKSFLRFLEGWISTLRTNFLKSVTNISTKDFRIKGKITSDDTVFIDDDLNISEDLKVTGNITTDSYFSGQPVKGYLGSGIIWAEEVDDSGNLNVSILAGLDVEYPAFTMRLVKTDNTEKYCNISSGSLTVPDETHSVYYIDNDCNIQNTAIQNYITTELSPGGIADFFNVISHSGAIEILEGVGLMNKEDIKIRKNTFKLSSLDVISGFGLTEENFPNISIGSGEYSYVNEIFATTSQNNSAGDTIELAYRQGGVWQYSDETGLNLTWCDDGTDSYSCTNVNKYRRYFIGILGRNDTTDTTELHQLAASETETYSNLGNCLDIVSSPLSFDLPSNYEYGFVLLYAYCGKPSDTGWTGEFMDLRTTRTGIATGLPDLSIFLTKDGARDLTNDWYITQGINSSEYLNSSRVEANEFYLGNNTNIFELGGFANTQNNTYTGCGLNGVICDLDDDTIYWTKLSSVPQAENFNTSLEIFTVIDNSTFAKLSGANFLGNVFIGGLHLFDNGNLSINGTLEWLGGSLQASNINVKGYIDSDDYLYLNDDVNISGFLNVTAGLQVDSGTLFVDSANDGVGIGTASPGTPLHVKSSGNNGMGFLHGY